MNRKNPEARMRKMARNLRREERRVLADPRHAELVKQAEAEVAAMRAAREKAAKERN